MATRTRNPARAALPEAATFLELLVTQDQLTAEVVDLLGAHDLTSQQYNVLRILRGGDAGGLPCQVIGERMIQRVPDVTRLVDRLEAAKLVERARTPEDRRVVLVRITAAGRALLATLDAPVDALHRKQFAALTSAELAELQCLLQKARERR